MRLCKLSRLYFAFFLANLACADLSQQPWLVDQQVSQSGLKPRKLHGRFLHLTDIHPDPQFRDDASVSSACHRRKPKSEKERSTKFGAPRTECDSPMSLVDLTFKWIEENWADEVDFVIWTGDSARHDNDRIMPRTPREIFDLNRQMVEKMDSIFGPRGVAVIPSLGNNDIWPHNIMTAGPNSVTNQFASIWKSYIPFPSFQVFQRGAYFTTEVIPNRLAVVSLNTLYFYDSNKAVGGCEWVNRDQGGGVNADPGNLELDWLEVQLDVFRQRGVKVWITGHVPPSPGNYFPECYWRYTELVLRYQDTILGQLFGHMNSDHFSYVDAHDLRHPVETEEIGTSKKKKKVTLYETLVSDFKDLKEFSRLDLEQYAIINVSPSVVPNPYLPSVRVWGYNATGLTMNHESQTQPSRTAPDNVHIVKDRKHGHMHPKKNRCKKKAEKHKWWCQMKWREWFTDPDSPTRKNVALTPLGYVQWWVPELGEQEPPTWQVEYATYRASVVWPQGNDSATWRPIPVRMIPEMMVADPKRFLVYEMADATVDSWMLLAEEIGKNETMQKVFGNLMYMGGEEG